jgi:hypothetical protein
MSGVLKNIDPPPPHRPASVYPTAFGAGGGHTSWVGGGGSIFWKTPDTALYSTYVSTLWSLPSNEPFNGTDLQDVVYSREKSIYECTCGSFPVQRRINLST